MESDDESITLLGVSLLQQLMQAAASHIDAEGWEQAVDAFQKGCSFSSLETLLSDRCNASPLLWPQPHPPSLAGSGRLCLGLVKLTCTQSWPSSAQKLESSEVTMCSCICMYYACSTSSQACPFSLAPHICTLTHVSAGVVMISFRFKQLLFFVLQAILTEPGCDHRQLAQIRCPAVPLPHHSGTSASHSSAACQGGFTHACPESTSVAGSPAGITCCSKIVQSGTRW